MFNISSLEFTKVQYILVGIHKEPSFETIQKNGLTQMICLSKPLPSAYVEGHYCTVKA